MLDITPTLLHVFDLHLGRDMDGRVLDRALLEEKEISYVDSWDEIEGDDGYHSKDGFLDAQDAQEAL